MKKQVQHVIFFMTAWLVSAGALLAQNKISGTVTDASLGGGLVGVSVQVKGKVIGTISDAKANFLLTTATPVPFMIVVSSVGYALSFRQYWEVPLAQLNAINYSKGWVNPTVGSMYYVSLTFDELLNK